MIRWFPIVHLSLCVVILMWDVVLAGRIAQLREAPPAFAGLTGFCALLLLPALILSLATSTVVTDRAVGMVDWIWPLTLVLFAAQAVYALMRRLVNVLWGLPIAVYDIVIATIGVVRFLVAHGWAPLPPFVALLAAQSTVMALATSSMAATTAVYFNVPLISPAFPARRRLTASFRMVMAIVAIGWTAFIFSIGMDGAIRASGSYRRHSQDQIHARPNSDFSIGLKILPDISGNPPTAAVRSDLALFDTIDANVVSVVVTPTASQPVLDSVSRVLDHIRRDSTVVIVAIGYEDPLLPELRRVPLDEAQRLVEVQRVVRRLHPDILLPAADPYGVGARMVGLLPVGTWERYLTNAARVAKAIDPHVRIGVSMARYGTADSVLYAWASQRGSPMDVVGFSLFPEKQGLDDLAETFELAADRWMSVMPPKKDVWVFAAGGFPLNYGELSQQRAIWQTLSWATGHAAIKGLVVYEAGDYGDGRGLRAPNGRLRPAAASVMRAIEMLKESADPGE